MKIVTGGATPRVIKNNYTVQSKNIGDLVQDRVLPRQVSSGSTRGTQTVGYGDTKIDGSNNRITVGDSIVLDGNTGTITTTNDDNSSVGLGIIPGQSSEFGFFATDADGTLIMKLVNGTLYTYHGDTGVNVVQVGALTNGEYGAAFAKDGEDLVVGLG